MYIHSNSAGHHCTKATIHGRVCAYHESYFYFILRSFFYPRFTQNLHTPTPLGLVTATHTYIHQYVLLVPFLYQDCLTVLQLWVRIPTSPLQSQPYSSAVPISDFNITAVIAPVVTVVRTGIVGVAGYLPGF